MKKFFISIVFVVAVFLVGCTQENNPPVEPEKKVGTISCSQDTIISNLSGDNREVEINSVTSWNAVIDKQWVRITPSSNTSGKTKVLVTIEEGEKDSCLIEFRSKNTTEYIESVCSLKIYRRPATCEITAISNDTTMGIVKGGGSYLEGEEITLQAIAKDGYEFIQWIGGEKSAILKILVKGDATYEAEFKAIKFYDGSTGGIFNIGSGKQVKFSRGNLQYNKISQSWSFAENQCKAGADGSTQNWQYLFAWSCTSQPYGLNPTSDRTIFNGDFVDWTDVEITNSHGLTWRTLSYEEWNYLLYSRPYASQLMRRCEIRGIYGGTGLVLIPDDANWYFYSSDDAITYISWEKWQELEEKGAVFLPSHGQVTIGAIQDAGIPYYWTSTKTDSSSGYPVAYTLWYYSGRYQFGYQALCVGQSVRLVSDIGN